jgi:hypothetical protein
MPHLAATGSAVTAPHNDASASSIASNGSARTTASPPAVRTSVKAATSGCSGIRVRRQPRQVRHQHVGAEVQLGLVEDDPATRAAAAFAERL